MALGLVHKSRAEKHETVAGQWMYLEPNEGKRAVAKSVSHCLQKLTLLNA